MTNDLEKFLTENLLPFSPEGEIELALEWCPDDEALARDAETLLCKWERAMEEIPEVVKRFEADALFQKHGFESRWHGVRN